MHIQAHDSILIASSHFFGFLSLDVVVCWTEGAAGLPTNTSNADIRGCGLAKTSVHLHEGSFRQDSLSLQSGIYPHCSARVPAGIALPFWFCPFASPISEANRMLRPRLPSSS